MGTNKKGLYENVNPSGWIEITPSDTTEYVDVCNLFIGGAGSVTIEGVKGQVVTFTNILDGTFLPCGQVKRVLAATTATDILGAI